MRQDVERWTDYVAWTLAKLPGNLSNSTVSVPCPSRPCDTGGHTQSPWFLVAMLWLVSVMAVWMLCTGVVPMLLHPWQPRPVAQAKSVAEWHTLCAETWARLPEEIPAVLSAAQWGCCPNLVPLVPVKVALWTKCIYSVYLM